MHPDSGERTRAALADCSSYPPLANHLGVLPRCARGRGKPLGLVGTVLVL